MLAWHEAQRSHPSSSTQAKPRSSISWSGCPEAVACCLAHLVAQTGTDAVAELVPGLELGSAGNGAGGKKGAVGAGVAAGVQQAITNFLQATRSPDW